MGSDFYAELDARIQREYQHKLDKELAHAKRAQRSPVRARVVVGGSCSRCCGTGVVDAYRHINGGLCYKCNGSGSK